MNRLAERIMKNRKGFTLAELIIAVAIMGLLGALFSEIVYSAIKARDSSRERLAALAIATSALDEIKSLRGAADTPSAWNTLGAGNDTDPADQGLRAKLVRPVSREAGTPAGLGYTRKAEIPGAEIYQKTITDSNFIEYTLELEIVAPAGNANSETTPVSGLFDLKATVSSRSVPGITATTRIRATDAT